MSEFGEKLRREREMRGITLEEIAEATKIGSRSLRALETEDFDKLPGGIFNKGFVRSYARYLGIDTEQAVTDFLSAEAAYSQSLSPGGVGAVEEVAPPAAGAWLNLAVLLVIAAALLFGGWKYWGAGKYWAAHSISRVPQGEPHSTTGEDSAATPQSPSATQAKPPQAEKQNSDSSSAQANPAGASAPGLSGGPSGSATQAVEFVVSVRARKPSWITINADGKAVMNDMLEADAERSVRAHTRMVLTLGNAAGVDVTHNGKPVVLDAEENKPKTVVFNSQGLTQ